MRAIIFIIVRIYGFSIPIIDSSKYCGGEKWILNKYIFSLVLLIFLTILINRFGTLSELFFQTENASPLCGL